MKKKLIIDDQNENDAIQDYSDFDRFHLIERRHDEEGAAKSKKRRQKNIIVTISERNKATENDERKIMYALNTKNRIALEKQKEK